MVNKKILSESELVEEVCKDVCESGKENLVVQAGHFPLLYEGGRIQIGIHQWGVFSPYSLELGCKVAEKAKDQGLQVQYVFFADDHTYQNFGGLNRRQRSTLRNKFYKNYSGPSAELFREYLEIMGTHGFDASAILRHDHGKKGREDCLLFSELVLRASGRDIENICAREYIAFVEDQKYFDKKTSHLVSFVPNKCAGHICDVALDEELEGLSSSHIFLETMTPLATKKELYATGRGVTYRRDTP